MTIRIEPVDANTADQSVPTGAHRAMNDLEADFFPTDPAAPLEHHRLESGLTPTPLRCGPSLFVWPGPHGPPIDGLST